MLSGERPIDAQHCYNEQWRKSQVHYSAAGEAKTKCGLNSKFHAVATLPQHVNCKNCMRSLVVYPPVSGSAIEPSS